MNSNRRSEVGKGVTLYATQLQGQAFGPAESSATVVAGGCKRRRTVIGLDNMGEQRTNNP